MASARPDFSGHWTISKDASRLEVEALGRLQEAVLHIVHEDPVFRLRRAFTLEGQVNEVAIDLTSDGKESVRREPERDLRMKLEWEGDALVFTTRITSAAGEATNVVRYRLLGNGRTLRAEERFRGPGLGYENLWVFERAGQDPLDAT